MKYNREDFYKEEQTKPYIKGLVWLVMVTIAFLLMSLFFKYFLILFFNNN